MSIVFYVDSTSFVGKEVRIDCECSLNRAIGHYLSLDLLHFEADGVGRLSIVQVFLVSNIIAILTLLLAFRSTFFFPTSWLGAYK